MKYSLHETPVPRGRKNQRTMHARIVADSKVDMEKLCKLVSAGSSFSSADVKGILEALKFWMGVYLSEGSTIEMEGLGHFYPTIRTKAVVDGKGDQQLDIRVDSIHFRCSPDLKRHVRQATLEEVKRSNYEKLNPLQRKDNILNYVKENVSINTTNVMRINACNKHTALNDLKVLMAGGKLLKAGKGKLSVYILPYSPE